MFLKLDAFILRWAQWFVRQIELFTRVSRRHLISGAYYMYFLVWVVATVGFLFAFIYHGFIFVSVGHAVVFSVLYGIVTSMRHAGTRAITTLAENEFRTNRLSIRAQRFIMFFGCIIFWLKTNQFYVVLTLWSTTVSVLLGVSWIYEYLICSQSVSEEERKQKNESFN